jgi:hypothetical protein
MKTIRRRVSDSDEDDTPLKSVSKSLSNSEGELKGLRGEVALPCEYDIIRLKSLAEKFDVPIPKELSETNSGDFGILIGKVEKVVFARQMELAGIIQEEEAQKSTKKVPRKQGVDIEPEPEAL